MSRLIDAYRLDKSKVSVGTLADEVNDRRYWLSCSISERLAGIEFMRQVLYGYDPSATRLQRVYTIVKLGED